MVRFTLAALMLMAPLAELRAEIPRLGIFRSKKPDTPDKEKAGKVKQLLDALKGETDEKKRLSAIEELAGFDPRTHVEVLPALVVSVKGDPSPSVRAYAASAIGEMKPVNQSAGVALEQTLANDPNEDVRKAAQAAVWQYHLNGYRSAGVNPSLPQTAEPPLATLKAKPVVVATPTSQVKVLPKGGVYQQTAEPPLAKPKVETVVPPVPNLTVPSLPTVPTVPPPN